MEIAHNKIFIGKGYNNLTCYQYVNMTKPSTNTFI